MTVGVHKQAMGNPVIIAVDPGGRYTGIVVRQGDTLHGHTLVVRKDGIVDYVNEVVDAVADMTKDLPLGYSAVSIEEMKPMRGIPPGGAFDACHVAGAVMSWWHEEIITVPPGGHGKRSPLREHYPEDLIGPREVVGSGQLNHCRAAWDQAEVAATEWSEEQRAA